MGHSCSQGSTFLSSTWARGPLAQIGAAPAEHLRVAVEFLERMVNMANMGIIVNMINLNSKGVLGIKHHLVTKAAAVTIVALTIIRQGPSSSNLASKCQPRSSLVTRKTS